MFLRHWNIKCSFNFHVDNALDATVLRYTETCDANALRFFSNFYCLTTVGMRSLVEFFDWSQSDGRRENLLICVFLLLRFMSCDFEKSISPDLLLAEANVENRYILNQTQKLIFTEATFRIAFGTVFFRLCSPIAPQLFVCSSITRNAYSLFGSN